MIHSMSGGVLSRNESMLFAKVDIGGMPYWYIAPFFVAAGDKVLAPLGSELREGTVLKCEQCTQQTAPVPVSRARALAEKL